MSKTLTMDYEEYKKELHDKFESGKDEYHRRMDAALKVYHNTNCDELLSNYEKYINDRNIRDLFSSMSGSKIL